MFDVLFVSVGLGCGLQDGGTVIRLYCAMIDVWAVLYTTSNV